MKARERHVLDKGKTLIHVGQCIDECILMVHIQVRKLIGIFTYHSS